MKCIRNRRHRIAKADRAAVEAEVRAQRTEAQWPEVRALSAWARETRERNHLGDKLQQIMRGTI